MAAKKDATSISSNHTHSSPSYQRELEVLYARRSAIDSLIKSLQTYDRYRAQHSDLQSRKFA
jgi:hypothetical protein